MIISAHVWADIHLFWNDFALQASKKCGNYEAAHGISVPRSYKGSLMHFHSFTLPVLHVNAMENKTYHKGCSILKGIRHSRWLADGTR
jgi:hypothetical protein